MKMFDFAIEQTANLLTIIFSLRLFVVVQCSVSVTLQVEISCLVKLFSNRVHKSGDVAKFNKRYVQRASITLEKAATVNALHNEIVSVIEIY